MKKHFLKGKNQKCFFTSEYEVLKVPLEGNYLKLQLTKYRLMKTHPFFFAEIYEIDTKFVRQQRLNCDFFIQNMTNLGKNLKHSGFYKNKDTIHSIYVFSNIIKYIQSHFFNSKKMADMSKKINPIYLPFFESLVFLVSQIVKLYPNADLHVNQFGYDLDGKLKCFDI